MEETKPAPDSRDEMADRLAIELGLEEERPIIMGILSDYEITKRSKEIIVYDGGQTEYLIKRFLVAKKVAGCTDRTIVTYGRMLRQMFREMGKSPLQLDHTDMQAQIARMIIRGNKKSYQQMFHRTMSSFYSWLEREELVPKNIMHKVDRIKCCPKHKKAFTDMEVEKIRGACRCARERCLVEVLLSTGCRIFEIEAMKVADVQGESLDIIGKGEKPRTVYFTAKAQLAIAAYLNERKDNNPWLFAGSIGVGNRAEEGRKDGLKGSYLWYTRPENVSPDKRQDKNTLGALIRQIGKMAGVEKCHPHRFRRTCATMALRRGMSLVHVQKMLGHNSLETTRIYLDITDDELAQSHKRFVV